MSARRDQRSAEAAQWRRWYNTARWRAIRLAQLRTEPLCWMCIEIGRVTAATVCDHAEPHRGDITKFWNGPFRSLCASHHNGDKQSEERTGQRRRKGVDASGRPLDPQHPWRARA